MYETDMIIGYRPRRDNSPNLENYECKGCRNEGSCGSCPHNSERIREWKNKYNNN